MCVKDVGVEVGAVRPTDDAKRRVDGNGCEERWILQRLEDTGEADEVRYVNDSLGTIVERNYESMSADRADPSDISHHRLLLLHSRKRLFPSEHGGNLYRPRRHAINDSESADDHLAERGRPTLGNNAPRQPETVRGVRRLQRCGERSGQRSAASLAR